MRYQTLKNRAREYAEKEMGWDLVECPDAKPAGRDGRGCAVLVHAAKDEAGLHYNPRRFVILFDEFDDIHADSENPGDWGFDD